jgi:hypothetical protein
MSEERELTGIEKAQAARKRNAELRRQGLLPPLARKSKPKPAKETFSQRFERAEAARLDDEEPPAVSAGGALSAERWARIREEARRAVEAELRTKNEASQTELIKQLLDEETLRLRREAGLTSHLDDIVEYTVNCPPFANAFVVDFTSYHHGHTYHLPRKRYDVLREMEARGWDAEERAGNPNRKFWRNPSITQNPFGMVQRDLNGTIVSRETTVSAMGGIIGAPTDTMMAGGL